MKLAEHVTAILKDIKVTKKGIVLTFEDVRLQGEQLTDLASLIGGHVVLNVDAPQISLFEDEDVNALEVAEEVEETVEPPADEPQEEDYSQVQFVEEEPAVTEGPARLTVTESDDDVITIMSEEDVVKALDI